MAQSAKKQKIAQTKEGRSHVLSIRLQPSQIERLARLSKRVAKTPSEMAAIFIEEALRRAEFGHIDFRSTSSGRRAYVMGSSLAVWEVIMIARNYAMNVKKTANHLEWPEFRVQAAFNYANANPQEIAFELAENDSYDFEKLRRSLPQAQLFIAQPAGAVVRESTAKYRTARGRASKKRPN